MQKNKIRHRQPSADEQQVLDQLRVRLVQPHEVKRFDALITEHHYLKNARVVGEHLRYVATHQGQWLGLATWSAAAWHLKARDAFIGWDGEQRRVRRPLLANNARLLILPPTPYPNLISRFMKLMLARLSADWRERWGHPLALAESFVDRQLYRGTAYKVSGWSQLGHTAGWQRSAGDFYQKHDRPKQIWVRELLPKACMKLRAPTLPPAWAGMEADAAPRCTARAGELRSLVERLRADVPEFRSKKALAYPLAGMLALIAQALFSGVRRGPQDLADYAATLSQGQLRALNFRPDRQTGRRRCPGVTPFRDVLARVDAPRLERALLRWQEQLLGPTSDPLVIVDGKTLRHAHVELVSAVNGAGRWLGTVAVKEKSSEIPAARELLGRVELGGQTTLADALHTQTQTVQQILFEGGGDYVLTVKNNQQELVQTLAARLTPGAFSPSARERVRHRDRRQQDRFLSRAEAHGADPCPDARGQSGPAGDPAPGLSGGDARAGATTRATAPATDPACAR